MAELLSGGYFVKVMYPGVDCERKNSFAKTHRSDILLKLGRVSIYKEFLNTKFRQLVQMYVEKYAREEMTMADVEKLVTPVYQYIDSIARHENSQIQYH